MAWKPTPRAGVDVAALPLSPLQGHVAQRLDGASDLASLARVTGLPPQRLEALLAELVALGVVEPDPDAPPPALSPPSAPPRPAPDLEPVTEPHQPAAPDPEAPDTGDASAAAVEADLDAPDDEGAGGAIHRELFETKLHASAVDDRAAGALTAVDPELSAYCFDPVPQVIKAVLDNPRTGLTQARLIARHHRHPVGLEAMAARAAFAADAGVRRGLLHNPVLPASLYRRLWGARRLLDQFKVTTSREVPEQTRRTARDALRQRFATGPAEERVELILKTEGRCLQSLTGLPVDSKTTALLCGRTFASTFLVQNVARWPAAPPALIAHLLRQETVRRNPTLRTLLERHPNAPSGHG